MKIQSMLGLSPKNQTVRATVASLLLLIACGVVIHIMALSAYVIIRSQSVGYNNLMMGFNDIGSQSLIIFPALIMTVIFFITIIDILCKKNIKDALSLLITVMLLNSIALIPYWIYQLMDAIKHFNYPEEN